MKNFLKVKPEKWKKEREIGQISFIIQRAVIFSLFIIPLQLLVNFILISKDENLRIAYIIFSSVILSFTLSIYEWIGLEFSYRKSINDKKLK